MLFCAPTLYRMAAWPSVHQALLIVVAGAALMTPSLALGAQRQIPQLHGQLARRAQQFSFLARGHDDRLDDAPTLAQLTYLALGLLISRYSHPEGALPGPARVARSNSRRWLCTIFRCRRAKPARRPDQAKLFIGWPRRHVRGLSRSTARVDRRSPRCRRGS